MKNTINLFGLCLVMAIPAFADVGIIVNKDLYGFIREAVDSYVANIKKIEQKNVWLEAQSFNETSNAQELRELLHKKYKTANLEGAVLIGDLPIVKFADGPQYYITDYYFMDLDGVWSGDSQYHYKTHTGNREMEIWVSRIVPGVLSGDSGSEEKMITEYFARVHKRMNCLDTLARTYLIFGNNIEWPMLEGENRNAFDYPLTAIYCFQRPYDRKWYWIDELCRGHEYVFLYEHSYELAHALSDELFTAEDYAGISTNVRFYNLFACSGSNYLKKNLGGFYALSQRGLVSLGSTKPGSMMPGSFKSYNDPLKKGDCFGEAFKKWSNTAGIANPGWHYGMVLQGAGTLRLKPYSQIPITHPDQKEIRYTFNVNTKIVNAHQHFVFNTTVPVHTDRPYLKIYAADGSIVFESAVHASPFVWTARSSKGTRVTPGIYFARITTSSGRHRDMTVKLTVLR